MSSRDGMIEREMQMKRLLTALLAVLFVGAFTPPAQAQVATGPILVLQETVLAQLMSTAEKLEELKADIKDMKNIPERDPAFWAKISENYKDDGYIRNTDPPKNIDVVINKGMEEAFDSLPVQIEPEVRHQVDRWRFANEVAQVNMRRDGNARNLKSETAFMYLSHFIDRQGGPKETIDPRISDEDVYAGWITNDDRRAYERYLKGARQYDVAFSTASFFTETYSALASVDTVRNVESFRIVLASLSGWDGVGLGDQINSISQLLNSTEDSFEAVRRIEDSLDRSAKAEGCKIDVRNDCAKNARTAIGLIISFGKAGLPGLLAGLQLEFFKYSLQVGKKTVDQAQWAALIRTYHGRISSRVMRNWGLL